MTDKVNPTFNGTADAYKTAGAIAIGGGSGEGFVQPADSPTAMAVEEDAVNTGGLTGFEQSHDPTLLDVTIGGGEGVVFGSWVVTDSETTVTLSADSEETVYVGWDSRRELEAENNVIIGVESDFSADDNKIPLWTFETDAEGVVAASDERTIGQTIDAQLPSVRTNSDYVTSGERIVFVDSSEKEVTITLATDDIAEGREVVIVDAAGLAADNTITIATEGTETIDGQATADIMMEYGANVVSSDGDNWFTSGGSASAWVDLDGDNLLETPNHDGIDVDRVVGKGVLTRQTVEENEVVEIPEDRSAVVVGPYKVKGTLKINGSFKVL